MTPGTSLAAAVAAATASRPSASVSGVSEENTIWAASPATSGKRSSSRSVAAWASEPGMVVLLTSLPPKEAFAANTATTITSHTPTVRQGCSAQARTSRASAPF